MRREQVRPKRLGREVGARRLEDQVERARGVLPGPSRGRACARPRPSRGPYSTRICLPLSFVPSSRSSACSAWPGVELDEREPVEHPDRADRVVRDHGALGERPADVLVVDPAAPPAVDEQLHQPVADRFLSPVRRGRRRLVPSAPRPRGVLEALLGRLPLPDARLRLALDPSDLGQLLLGHEGDRAARPPHPSGAPDPMDVRLGHVGNVVVDHVGDVLDVEAAGGDVGGRQQPQPVVLEGEHHPVALRPGSGRRAAP